MNVKMITCEGFRNPIRMMARACMERQARARAHVDETGRHVHHLPMSFEACLNCKQGEKIWKEMKMKEDKAGKQGGEEAGKPGGQEAGKPEKSLQASKVCRICGQEKPETDFYLGSSGKYRENKCKKCKALTSKKDKENRRSAKGKREPASPDLHPSSFSLQSSALSRQVGGDHYKSFQIQPVEFSTKNGLKFLQGSIVKRICRYNIPGGKGLEDLEKIIHEVELLKEMEYTS